MTIRILESQREIGEVQRQLEQAVRAVPHETIPTTIRFQGGSFKTDVLWISALRIWAHFGSPPSQKANFDRYWNVFGLDRPTKSVRVICEVNSPLEGIKRSIGGAFAADPNGRFHILHRGRFRSHGMTKAYFWRHYKGPIAQVADGEASPTLALVTVIGSPSAPQDLRDFILEVRRIKELAK